MMEFQKREDIIKSLVDEYGMNSKSFNNTPTNKQREKFWTFNRLIHYYYDIRHGRKETYRTSPDKNGIFRLKK